MRTAKFGRRVLQQFNSDLRRQNSSSSSSAAAAATTTATATADSQQCRTLINDDAFLFSLIIYGHK